MTCFQLWVRDLNNDNFPFDFILTFPFFIFPLIAYQNTSVVWRDRLQLWKRKRSRIVVGHHK